MIKIQYIFLISFAFTSIVACKRKGCIDQEAINYNEKAKKDDGSCEYESFDRQLMLTDIADNSILPAYDQCITSVELLQTALQVFIDSATVNSLRDAQDKFKDAYLQWQEAEMYEFGPAGDQALLAHMNTFPTDESNIENAVSSGSWNMSSFTSVGHKGFGSLDYLLFHADDSVLISEFITSTTAANRAQFSLDVIEDMLQRMQQVRSDWDGYRSSFISSTGTEVGTSLALMVNAFSKEIELLKNARLGIPSGIKTGVIMTEQLEGYYSETSMDLLLANNTAMLNLFVGDGSGNYKSLYDFLKYLQRNADDNSLADAIVTQFNQVKSHLEQIPEPLKQSLNNEHSSVQSCYSEMVKLVALVKSDMTSAMSISISYTDNDGD